MKEIQIFRKFIELLAKQHQLIKHSKKQCHFSCTVDGAQNKYAATMHYPCVVLDIGDIEIRGTASQSFVETEYYIFFLDHVKDTGSEKEIVEKLDNMRQVALDFLAKMVRCKKDFTQYPWLSRIDVVGTQLQQIVMESPALYGYCAIMKNSQAFRDIDCENVFGIKELFAKEFTQSFE